MSYLSDELQVVKDPVCPAPPHLASFASPFSIYLLPPSSNLILVFIVLISIFIPLSNMGKEVDK